MRTNRPFLVQGELLDGPLPKPGARNHMRSVDRVWSTIPQPLVAVGFCFGGTHASLSPEGVRDLRYFVISARSLTSIALNAALLQNLTGQQQSFFDPLVH
jgi:hypothetical protein